MVALALFLITTQGPAVYGAEKDYSGALKDLKLYVPDKPADRAYLGIKETSGQIPLTKIKADILLIEIFSMYCPHCQKQAPELNNLYQAIDSKEEFRDKIKIIGIGIGNSPYEVGIFKDKYLPPFPLFDDRHSAVVNSFGGVLTPHFFGLRMQEDSSFEVFYSKDGSFTDAEEFLEMIMKSSGITLGGNK
ncbi:MAG: redoxin domain-containing protein [Deltaproteobacteria bacterium]|nr:redoxin domain-containing protein [Deltaproteobacteria bacterium]